jgi:hypothetical protein
LGGISHHFVILSGDPQINGGALKVEGSAMGRSKFFSFNQLCFQGLGKKGDHFFKILADDMQMMKSK